MGERRVFSLPGSRPARPIAEPLAPPPRPTDGPRRRISVGLDQDRYVALRTAAATHRLSGEDIVIVALDRLLAGL